MDQFPPREPPPPPPVPPLPQPQYAPPVPDVPWRAREGIIILILSLLSGLFFSALAASAIEDRDTLTLIVTIIIEANLAAWVLLWVWLRHRVGLKALGWNFRLEDIGIGFVAALIGLGVSSAASQIVQSIYEAFSNKQIKEPEQLPQSALHGGKIALAALAVVVVAPLAEELFFRGFLYQALRKWRGVMGATILSAIFFAVAHGAPILILAIFPLGIVLAFVFERRNSIAATIAAHAFFNAAGLLFILSSR